MNHIANIVDYLEDHSVGTVGTDLFEGYLPNDPDSCVCVIDTGGLEPDVYIPTFRPTFQISIRNTSYATGRTKLDTIRDLLHRKQNATLVGSGEYFFYISANSNGGSTGVDEQGRYLFSINFTCLLRGSDA